MSDSTKIPLIVIAGPTASGKTKLGVELAKKYNGEIVSADSMQIYKKMNIATAKPTIEDMDGIKHHLIDFVDQNLEYSVNNYLTDAKKAITEIYNNRKIPILVGGTGLYITSLIDNIKFAKFEKPDNEILKIKDKIEFDYQNKGGEYLYSQLQEIDPKSADEIHKNNIKRVKRALEIYYQTGKTKTENIAVSKLEESEYNYVMIAIGFNNRENLYKKINCRVNKMLENGLLKETKEFYQIKHQKTAVQAIGYKELKPFIDGEISFEEATENLKKATRHYAKRQLTWFRKDERFNWVLADDEDCCNNYENFLKKVEKIIEDNKILCYNLK